MAQNVDLAHDESLPERITDMAPTTILRHELSKLPTRNQLLEINEIINQYRSENYPIPILFHPITVLERDEWIKNPSGYGGKHVFVVNLFGIDQFGRKTAVRLVDTPIYVDIMVPKRFLTQTSEFYTAVMSSLTSGQTRPDVSHWDIVHGYKLHGFQRATRPWLRFHFANLGLRSAFLDLVAQHNVKYKDNKKQQYQTANDDLGRPESGYYFNKIARERGINTAGWNLIASENPADIVEINAPYCSLNNFAKGYECNINCLTKCRNKVKNQLDPVSKRLIERPKALSMFWDIETEGGRDIDDHDNMDVFNISMMFYTLSSDKPILSIGLTKHNTRSFDGYVIVCGSELGVVKTFLEILHRYLPDYDNGFNSQRFDWRVMFHKFKRYNLFQYINENVSLYQFGQKCNLERKFFTREQIKINAEKTHISDYVAKIPGMLDSDTQPLFYKLYPKMEIKLERSLNYFLQLNDLPAKDDMPINRLWRIKRYGDALDNITSCHCDNPNRKSELDVDCCKLCVSPDPFDINAMGKFDPARRISADLVPRCNPDKCCRCNQDVYAFWLGLGDHYCKIDSHRTQQLIFKRGIYVDKCELANLSYVQLYDAFYRADGMKVRNIIGRYAPRFNIMFSNARKQIEQKMKQHYPGAWVFPPKYGYYKHRPITGEDFSSLYPSIMMCYNYSPDRVVTNPAKAEELKAMGYKLHPVGPIRYEQGEKKGQAGNIIGTVSGWMVAHGNIYDPKRDKQVVNEYEKQVVYKIMDAENPSKVASTHTFVQPIRAEWTAMIEETPIDIKTSIDEAKEAGRKVLREVKYLPKPTREPLINERMGIFGYVLKKLFDKRVPIKREFVKLCKIMEIMKKKGLTTMVYELDGKTYHLKDVEFDAAKLDAIQKALKVLCNTFYGESGNFRSAIYKLLVAAGITSQGQLEIKFVSDGVIINGFKLYYGDTDSMYISAPEKVFAMIDAWFAEKSAEAKAIGDDALLRRYREEYYTLMVQLTMDRMQTLCEEISDRLIARTGTRYLNMAYEEVGFPTAWCGKKKYFMTAHIQTINFEPTEYFLRGVEIVKQGVNQIIKVLGNEFIKEAMDIHSDREPIDIARDKLVKFFTHNWSIDMFAQTATYKPTKDNKSVKRFHERMTAVFNTLPFDDPNRELYRPPDAGDKFKYVIVKRPEKINQCGNKEKSTKGDFMEYLDVYIASQSQSNPLELDLEWYFERSFITSFSRFICYHPSFAHPNPADPDDDDEYRINSATEWLKEQADKFSDKEARAEKMKRLQAAYRKVYKEFNKEINNALYKKFGEPAVCLTGEGIYKGVKGLDNRYEVFDLEEIKGQTGDVATNWIDKWCNNVGETLERANPMIEPIYAKCSELPAIRLVELRKECISNIQNNDVIHNNTIDQIRKTLRIITPVMTDLIRQKNNIKGEIVSRVQMNCGGEYDKVVFDESHVEAVTNYLPHEQDLVIKFHNNVSKLITCYRLKTRNKIKLSLVANAIKFRNIV